MPVTKGIVREGWFFGPETFVSPLEVGIDQLTPSDALPMDGIPSESATRSAYELGDCEHPRFVTFFQQRLDRLRAMFGFLRQHLGNQLGE